MAEKAVILDEKSMNRAIARISCEIVERNKGVDDLCLIGIISRGVYIAQRIAIRLKETEGFDIPIGFLDITAYRDDVKAADSDKSSVSFDIHDKKVVLVDMLYLPAEHPVPP